jgi:hypothetical protein
MSDIDDVRQLRWGTEFKIMVPTIDHPRVAAEKLREVANLIEAIPLVVWRTIVTDMLDQGKPCAGLVGHPFRGGSDFPVDIADVLAAWGGIWRVEVPE